MGAIWIKKEEKELRYSHLVCNLEFSYSDSDYIGYIIYLFITIITKSCAFAHITIIVIIFDAYMLGDIDTQV